MDLPVHFLRRSIPREAFDARDAHVDASQRKLAGLVGSAHVHVIAVDIKNVIDARQHTLARGDLERVVIVARGHAGGATAHDHVAAVEVVERGVVAVVLAVAQDDPVGPGLAVDPQIAARGGVAYPDVVVACAAEDLDVGGIGIHREMLLAVDGPDVGGVAVLEVHVVQLDVVLSVGAGDDQRIAAHHRPPFQRLERRRREGLRGPVSAALRAAVGLLVHGYSPSGGSTGRILIAFTTNGFERTSETAWGALVIDYGSRASGVTDRPMDVARSVIMTNIVLLILVCSSRLIRSAF